MRVPAIFFLCSLFFLTSCLNFDDEEGYDNSEDLAYLEEYAGREDVTETDTGLLYRVIEEGDGEIPDRDSRVRAHYTGRLVNGGIFDNTRESGDAAEFPLNNVIAGFAEGIMLMQEDAEYELVLPPDLAYDDTPPYGSGIPPGAVLIFEVELLEIL